MAFDYKKEYKEFYLPPKKPQIITIPSMNFIAVREKVIQTKKMVPIKSLSDFYMASPIRLR